MKDMKHISSFVCVLAIGGLLFVPGVSLSQAATMAAFNNDPHDVSTLLASDYTQHQDSSSFWTSNVQGVQAGDVVSFRFYYHNTGTVTASNTRMQISFAYGASGVTATGKLWANNTSAVYGTASVNTASQLSGLSLSFNSAVWYPNRGTETGTTAPLPSGQNGSSVASASGVSIGDIAPGWNTAGYLVVRFKVNGTVPQSDPDFSLSASPSGMQNVVKPGQATYTVSAAAVSGTPGAIALSLISGNSNITGSFSNTSINAGQSATLVVNIPSSIPDGAQSVLVRGISGNKTHDVTLTINISSQTSQNNQATLTISPNASTLQVGQSVQFSVSYDPDGASGAQSAQDVTQYATWSSSQQTVASSLGAGQFYGNAQGSATASANYGGLTATAPLTVSGNGGSNNQNGAPFVQTLAATNLSNNSATLTGLVNPNNSQTVYHFEFGTNTGLGSYTYYNYLSAGTGAQTVSIPVYNLTPNSTYFYRVVAQNSSGTSYGDVMSFSTYTASQNGAPIVQTDPATNILANSATLAGELMANGADATYHFEYGTTQNLGASIGYGTAAANNSGTQFASASLGNLSANTTYYYRLVAQNSYGASYGQILNFTTPNGYQNNYGTAPYVTTNPAEYVALNSALVNGSASSNYGVADAWFEYGTNSSLGLSTISQSVNSAGAFSFAMLNLTPDTTYYFRAAASNQYGTGYGSVLTFRTNPVATITPVTPPAVTEPPKITYITNNITSVGNEFCVTLLPAVSAPQVASGEEFDYSVTFKNNCSFALANAALAVTLPANTRLVSTNLPFALKDTETQTYNLGSVPKGYQGTIVIRSAVTNTSGKDDAALYAATLSFTDAKNNPQSLSANIGVVVSAAGLRTLASVLSLLGGLSWWWLLVLVALALGVYWYYRKKE